LVEQVGGSVESATDDFASLEAAIADTKNELAKEFVPAVADAAKKVTTWLNFHAAQDQYDELIEKVREFDETAAEGAETRMRAVQREHGAWVSFTEQQDEIAALGGEIDTLTQLMAEQEVALGARAAAFLASQWQTHEWTQATQEAMEAELELRAANREIEQSMIDVARAREAERSAVDGTTEAHRELTRARVDDGREAIDWAEALKGHADELQAQAEAQATALAKAAEARRQAAADLGDEFTEALGDTADAAGEIDEVTARLDELYAATGRTVTVAASSAQEHNAAALAMYSAEDAAARLAGAQALLAENTDPEQQRALEVAVLRAQQGLWRAQESATGLNDALTEGSSYITNYSGEIERLEARLEALQGKALVEELYAAADAAGASASTLALLAAATGDYTDEQIKAALKTAALQEKIEALGAEIAGGSTTIGEAITELESYRERLEEVAEADDLDIDLSDAALSAMQRVEGFGQYMEDDFPTAKDVAVTDDAEDAQGRFEDLEEAIGAIPEEVAVTIHTNLAGEIAKARQLKLLLLNLPESTGPPTWTGYDDDPTSLH
jgi:predicted  nucleic acid-binding Zn-ribbon protein